MRPHLALLGILSVLFSSLVASQAQSWVAADYPDRPVGMAFDTVRGRLLMVSSDALARLDTWTLHSTGSGRGEWHRLELARQPDVAVMAMASDPGRARIVLVGRNRANRDNETWEWDGVAWHRMSSTSPFPGKLSSAMAYDPVARQCILFGGVSQTGTGNDTWAWTGGPSWTRLTPATSPPRRSGHRLATDTARGRVVMFGGRASQQAPYWSDTWEWDGANWQRRLGAQPPGRLDPLLVYDPFSRRTLLFGGLRQLSQALFAMGDTWVWNGVVWIQRGTTSRAGKRGAVAAAHDGRSQRVLLAGGFAGSGLTVRDTWSWTGSDWREVVSSPLVLSPLALDRRRGVWVMNGGREQSSLATPVQGTWELGARGWTAHRPSSQPPPGRRLAVAHDPLRQRTVAFGTYPGSDNRTWEWDGLRWVERMPAGPLPNPAPAVAGFDPVRNRVVLNSHQRSGPAEDWEWDGLGWTRVTTTAPELTALATDHRRQRLYGYCESQRSLWLRSGTAWQRLPSTRVPSPGRTSLLADEATGLVWALVDGFRDELWTFGSSGWVQVQGPLPDRPSALIQDPDGNLVILTGDLRRWTRGRPATIQQYGSACSGRGQPLRVHGRRPQVDRARFDLAMTAALPNAVGAFLIGSQRASTPIGACQLLVGGAAVALPAQANFAGFAESLPLLLPRKPGLSFYAQAITVDPSGPSLGLRWSSGAAYTLGF